jgi:hypothetical protein
MDALYYNCRPEHIGKMRYSQTHVNERKGGLWVFQVNMLAIHTLHSPASAQMHTAHRTRRQRLYPTADMIARMTP